MLRIIGHRVTQSSPKIDPKKPDTPVFYRNGVCQASRSGRPPETGTLTRLTRQSLYNTLRNTSQACQGPRSGNICVIAGAFSQGYYMGGGWNGCTTTSPCYKFHSSHQTPVAVRNKHVHRLLMQRTQLGHAVCSCELPRRCPSPCLAQRGVACDERCLLPNLAAIAQAQLRQHCRANGLLVELFDRILHHCRRFESVDSQPWFFVSVDLRHRGVAWLQLWLLRCVWRTCAMQSRVGLLAESAMRTPVAIGKPAVASAS